MSPRRAEILPPRTARLLLSALALAAVPLTADAAPQGALQACASIVADADRLACYDRRAGRAGPSAPAQAAPAPAAAVPRAAALAPAAAATPSAAAAPPVARTASAASPAAPATPPKESFGLYEAEHPKPPPAAAAASLEARVVAVGTSASGHTTVSLEGGAVWEMDDSDPLLAAGESVSITRAALGSYLMHTPTKRTHRVRRLR